ncbi:hypothetical protein [Carboxylicivirga sp. N1Y90]|uniref:hypothetical protein n=1 Tax=Carboxylicivirga fragile TaxID=3417571 RepID=UPI003D3376F8|nr:hypothetical protein [Marinilabiliaceae bacterium N1Y90]
MSYIKNITIQWTYPKTFESAYYSDDSYGRGVYQITRVFGGNESLLYIGLVKKEGRDFYKRLEEHKKDWLDNVRGKVYIRFGKLEPRQGFTLSEEVIETIEGALIYEHEPKENTCKRNTYTIHHDMLIFNEGFRGYMKPQVDTRKHETDYNDRH